ncbi:MAG: HPr family phosphocarrier protein [Chloroflexi bacterium]|nr:HPr family phosphocarrier protein [Chloroflexota bacterium]
MAQREVIVGSRVGLHARPAALFVKTVSAQPVKMTIRKGDGAPVDARSILRVLALGAKHGDTVVLEADGEGAEEALDAVATVVAEDHDDPA